MFSKEIATLLQKSLPALPEIVCGRSLRLDMDDLVGMVLPRMKLGIVDDYYTSEASGDDVWRALKGRFECTRITLDRGVAADMEAVSLVRRKSGRCDALVAVGSGTISDICKYASHADGKPYVVFPTAASMNGYLSANASITVDGYKKTMAAHMPKAMFCDLSVIAAAPVRLSKSGLGDLLARPTAQADWLLSHLLLGTPYNETPFTLLQSLEGALFDEARGIAGSNPASIEILMQVLLLSGLGMTIAGGSYPASQGEHMIAHAMGMLKTPQPMTLHGEEISVTSLTMARMQEALLRTPPALRSTVFPKEKITELFGAQVAEEAKKSYTKKLEDIEKAALAAHVIKNKWDDIAHALSAVMMPSGKIEAILKAAACPDKPEMLGWHSGAYDTVVSHARFLRERFTFLDLQS